MVAPFILLLWSRLRDNVIMETNLLKKTAEGKF